MAMAAMQTMRGQLIDGMELQVSFGGSERQSPMGSPSGVPKQVAVRSGSSVQLPKLAVTCRDWVPTTKTGFQLRHNTSIEVPGLCLVKGRTACLVLGILVLLPYAQCRPSAPSLLVVAAVTLVAVAVAVLWTDAHWDSTVLLL